MKSTVLTFLLFVLLGISTFLYAQPAKKQIIGDWLTSDKNGVITMYYGNKKGEDSNKIYGKLTWIDEPNNEDGTAKKDKENPEENLRNRTILGLIIIKDLEWEGDEEEWSWEDGNAYDPESGNTYSFKSYIDPSKPDVLYCRGYLGFSLLGRTEVWTRKK